MGSRGTHDWKLLSCVSPHRRRRVSRHRRNFPELQTTHRHHQRAHRHEPPGADAHASGVGKAGWKPAFARFCVSLPRSTGWSPPWEVAGWLRRHRDKTLLAGEASVDLPRVETLHAHTPGTSVLVQIHDYGEDASLACWTEIAATRDKTSESDDRPDWCFPPLVRQYAVVM